MMTGTLRQTVGRWFPTICSKCVEPSVIKNRKARVVLPGALFSSLGYFQEPRFSPCGRSGRARGPSENVLKWQRGRDCCAHLLRTQVTASLLMGPRALVTSQICRPGLRKCSPRALKKLILALSITLLLSSIFFSSYSFTRPLSVSISYFPLTFPLFHHVFISCLRQTFL